METSILDEYSPEQYYFESTGLIRISPRPWPSGRMLALYTVGRGLIPC